MSIQLTAETGARYRATIRLGWLQSALANQAAITEKIRAAGLVNIYVLGSGRDWIADATWPGPTQTVDLPDEITGVKRIG